MKKVIIIKKHSFLISNFFSFYKVRVKHLNNEVTEIDEAKIDRLLFLLHEADPTGERPDSEELLQLEEQCLKMGPLIDQELGNLNKHCGFFF